MTVTTVALLLISAGFVAYEVITVQQRMRHDLSAQSRMIADLAAPALSHTNVAEAERVLSALAEREHIKAAAIYRDNKLIAHYPAEARSATFPAVPEPDDAGRAARFQGASLLHRHHLSAKATSLCDRSPRQVGPTHTCGKSQVILDAGTLPGLASWSLALDQNRS